MNPNRWAREQREEAKKLQQLGSLVRFIDRELARMRRKEKARLEKSTLPRWRQRRPGTSGSSNLPLTPLFGGETNRAAAYGDDSNSGSMYAHDPEQHEPAFGKAAGAQDFASGDTDARGNAEILEQLFEMLDVDSNGFVERREVLNAVVSNSKARDILSKHKWLKNLLRPHGFSPWLHVADLDQDGKISKEEFHQFWINHAEDLGIDDDEVPTPPSQVSSRPPPSRESLSSNESNGTSRPDTAELNAKKDALLERKRQLLKELERAKVLADEETTEEGKERIAED